MSSATTPAATIRFHRPDRSLDNRPHSVGIHRVDHLDKPHRCGDLCRKLVAQGLRFTVAAAGVEVRDLVGEVGRLDRSLGEGRGGEEQGCEEAERGRENPLPASGKRAG